MHATIDVRFELSIDNDKTLPLAALGEELTEQNIEATILEQLVASLDEQLVEALCGEKHARGNGNKRFQRRGTKLRSAVTTAGEHDLNLHYVEDTAADHDEESYFRPIEDIIAFNGQKQYQQDISFQSADIATKLSYRDAATHSDGILSMPSRSTINRRVKEYGNKLVDYLHDQLAGTNADTVLADGTKCHSQDDATAYNDVHVTLGQDEGDDATTLLDVSVDDDWEDTAIALEEIEAVTDDAEVVSDAEEELTEAFTAEDRLHQLDLVHVPRTTSYKLWEDGAFPLEKRKQIVSEVTNDLFHLKNSVEKHRPNEEWAAIRERIATTKQRMRHLAWQLEQLSSPKTARYLRRWLPSMVMFAEAALDGFEVPWTSNPVERAMGEVSKRCKNQWMQWSAAGLEALLQLRLVSYANPDQYQAFKHDLLQRSTKASINCELSVEATRGKL
jgi:hypothetical protein